MKMNKPDIGSLLSVPNHRYLENLLGFETDLITLDGLPAENVYMEKTSNTRKTNEYIENLIKERSAEITKNPKAKYNPRARFEGSFYDNNISRLDILWSDERYMNHAALSVFFMEPKLPRHYKANLFTISGIPLTTDKKIPIVIRNPKATDHGRIRHIAPAGFVDVKPEGAETPHEATEREFREELRYKDAEMFPQEIFNPSDMRVLGIVYNSLKNFDYTASVLIPLNAESNDIYLKGEEHEEIEWVGTDYEGLKELLLDLSMTPDTNSGHLRGAVALTIGHIYGEDAYEETLDRLVLDIFKSLK